MSFRVTYQCQCDRCEANLGESQDANPDAYSERAPLVSIEAVEFGIELKAINDLCEDCRTVIKGLLPKLISAAPKKGKAKKKEGKA